MVGTAALLMFVMTVAAGNLCLGFAVAVYLGIGPKSWPPKFIELWNAPEPADDELASLESSEPEAEEGADASQPANEPPPSHAAEPDEHPVASAFERFGRGFDRFEAELADWDSRRRVESGDADTFANAAIELNGLATGYLDNFQMLLEPISMASTMDSDADAARKTLAACANELCQQLRAVCAELPALQFDMADDLSAGDKLTIALTEILSALHAARNQLEEPLVALLGTEVHEATFVDMLKDNVDTSLLGRLCFEHVWLAGEGYRLGDEVGSAAMIDVDGLEQLHAEQGPLVVRRVLGVIGQVTREAVGTGVVAARLLGKEYVLSLPDQSPHVAAELIERIRQQVEQMHFKTEKGAFQLTVSAAVVAVAADDTPVKVIARLRSTTGEAKTYGRNRTFLWEEKAPTPVVPPKLEIAPRTVTL